MNVPSRMGIPLFIKELLKSISELSKQTFEGEYEIPKNLPKGAISIYDELFKKAC